MRKITCNLTNSNQMLTMTRVVRNDNFEEPQVISSFNKLLTETIYNFVYLITKSPIQK